jgi:hypothetical protein
LIFTRLWWMSFFFITLFSCSMFNYWFLCIDLYHGNLLKGSFRFAFVLAVNNWTSSLIEWLSSIALPSNSNTILNKSIETGYCCLLTLEEKVSVFPFLLWCCL